MSWLKKISQNFDIENGNGLGLTYLDFGHTPDDISWVYTNGEITTHQGPHQEGIQKGIYNNYYSRGTFAGRYEPETGILTIYGEKTLSIPSVVLDALYEKFNWITKVYTF